MKKLRRNFFQFSKNQRKGIFALFLLVLITQIVFLLYVKLKPTVSYVLSNQDQEWLNQQIKLDSIQAKDSVKNNHIYPFNPNFITDFKGYQLGMSVSEIDRLFAFRQQGKYVNSAKEFQEVTQISDSLLYRISPYFKFPDWVHQKEAKSNQLFANKNNAINTGVTSKINLNTATLADLQQVFGIGPVLSARIVAQREKYKAFVAWEQLHDIYGVTPEVIENMKRHFEISTWDAIEKIAINNADIKEIALVPYVTYNLARQIVIHRSKYGDFKTISDLIKVPDFPEQHLSIIEHYITFN